MSSWQNLCERHLVWLKEILWLLLHCLNWMKPTQGTPSPCSLENSIIITFSLSLGKIQGQQTMSKFLVMSCVFFHLLVGGSTTLSLWQKCINGAVQRTTSTTSSFLWFSSMPGMIQLFLKICWSQFASLPVSSISPNCIIARLFLLFPCSSIIP